MSKYKYTDQEKELLKVLKMQSEDLKDVESTSNAQEQELLEIRKQALKIAKQRGIDISQLPLNEYIPEEDSKISKDDIPSWESLVERANQEIIEDVIIEDLLSKEEFQFCIDEVERINLEFESKVALNKTDIIFLMTAAALQTLRWVLIQEFCGDLGEKINPEDRLDHNDASIKDAIKEANNGFKNNHKNHGSCESNKGYKSWEQIIFDSVPYDANVGSPIFNEKLEGKYHRYKTLGHDPILGWVFGTANIITDTITLSNFNSYRIIRQGGPKFHTPTNLFEIFYETFDSVKEDYLRLPAALFAQSVHLESDQYTKLGLPIPILEIFSENIAGKLYKSQYDSLCLMKDLMIVGNQMKYSIFINMIIGIVHGLFYNPQKDGTRDFYEARTRKVLSYSNALASLGNIAYAIGTEDWRKLDVGGIIITIGRLFSDIRFITKLKKDFIQGEIDKVLEQTIKNIDAEFE